MRKNKYRLIPFKVSGDGNVYYVIQRRSLYLWPLFPLWLDISEPLLLDSAKEALASINEYENEAASEGVRQ